MIMILILLVLMSFLEENKKFWSKNSYALNKEQKKAVEYIDGNSFILACPGSGKTHTIVYKVANLIKSGVSLDSIVLITYTKKAAGEMLYRLKTILNKTEGKFTNIGTIHHFAYNILQRYYETSFTILDEADAKKVIKELMEKMLDYHMIFFFFVDNSKNITLSIYK